MCDILIHLATDVNINSLEETIKTNCLGTT